MHEKRLAVFCFFSENTASFFRINVCQQESGLYFVYIRLHVIEYKKSYSYWRNRNGYKN